MECDHDFIVTDLLDTDFLIGLDFLHQHGISVNFSTMELTTNHGTVCNLHPKPANVPAIKRIRCEKTVTLPPNSAQIISGKAPRFKKSYQGITDPCHNTIRATGAIIGPSLVYTDKDWVPVQCLNIKDEPVVIYRGSTLGFLKPAAKTSSLRDVKVVATSPHQYVQQLESARDTTHHSRWSKKALFDALRLKDIEVEMTPEERAKLQDVLWRYNSCFAVDKDDFGCCNMFQAHIQLKPDYTPSWTPERKVPYHLEHHMEKHLKNMLDTGVIEPLKTESRWNSPLFLVAKSSPDSYRVVSDLRGVNKQCIPDKWDLPNLNYVLDGIGGDSVFSTFDMAASFHQVPYDQESKTVTAFSYKGKRYNFARMIMGHCDSSATFSKMMHRLLAFTNIQHLIYFLDDLLIGSSDVASHIDRLEVLLKQLESANLKLTPSKTSLLRKQVQYVGLTLSSRGININDDRVEAILKLPAPTSKKETQRVLGTLGYNRRFVRQYSAISKPLYDLLRKDKKFVWDSECQKSFDALKAAIGKNTTLCFPDVDDPDNSYQVEIDASQFGLASTLTQVINGERRIVGYFSKSVPRHKRQWGQTKLEFESLCASLKHWDPYLRGSKKFVVKTDCKSFLNLDSIFKNSPTMIRRFEQLSQYNFVIEHIAGKMNTLPDFLSRFGMKVKECNKSTQTREDDATISPHVNCVNQQVLEHSQTASHTDKSPVEHVKEPTYLEKLFATDTEHESVVTSCTVSTVSNCFCEIPELRKQANVNTVQPEDLGKSVVSNTTQVIPDRKKIREEQDKDQILKVVKDWVSCGERPKLPSNRAPAALTSLWKQYNLLKIEDGLLMKRWVSKKDLGKERDLIIVPENLIEPIMELHHSTLTSCHPGVSISVELCRRKFYWPKMTDDFSEYIAACEKCSAIKQPRNYLRAPLQHLLFHEFNAAIVVDHIVVEAKGRTPRGYRYILTITDAWSNYLVAVPVKTQTAKENIEQIVRRWVLTFGLPKEIIVDNHPGFTADFFHAVWDYFDCKVTHGTSYSKSSQAKAERSNKRVGQALRAALPEGKEHSWDIFLGYCVMALNSLKNRHTGFSSNRLVFGRENNTPISLLVDNEIRTQPLSKSTRGAYEQYKLMKNINRKVRENADIDFLYAKNQHDRNRLGPYFKTGDLCYVLINCPSHKHSIRWRGPLLVNKVINDHLYVVQISPGIEKVVNISKMKHFARNKFNVSKYPAPEVPVTSQQSVAVDSSTSPSKGKAVLFPAGSDDSDSSDEDDGDEGVEITLPLSRERRPSQSTDHVPLRNNSASSTPPVGAATLNEAITGNSTTANLTAGDAAVPDDNFSSDDSIVSYDTINLGDDLSTVPEQTEGPQSLQGHGYSLRDRATIRKPRRFNHGTVSVNQSPQTRRSVKNTVNRILSRVRDQLDGIF